MLEFSSSSKIYNYKLLNQRNTAEILIFFLVFYLFLKSKHELATLKDIAKVVFFFFSN